MKPDWTWPALLGLPLLWAAQSPQSRPTELVPPQRSEPGLTRVPAARDLFAAEAPQAAAFDEVLWRNELKGADLDLREGSFDRLLEAARENSEARKAIESWAQDTSDTELAWTARLLLRDLEHSRGGFFGAPGLRARVHGPLTFDFFGKHGQDPFSGGNQFEEFERQIEELFDRAGQGLATPHGGLFGGTQHSQSESMRIESGPDGIRVEVHDSDGEGDSTKTYEAESFEQLLEDHPELEGKVQLWSAKPGQNIRIGPGAGLRGDLDGIFDQMRARLHPGSGVGAEPAEIPTDILGIAMTERARQGDVHDRYAGVPEGVGLHIERIYPGTIAEVLGIRRGDLLIELNGRQLLSGADVSETLAQRLEGESVSVTLIDQRGQRKTLSWTP